MLALRRAVDVAGDHGGELCIVAPTPAATRPPQTNPHEPPQSSKTPVTSCTMIDLSSETEASRVPAGHTTRGDQGHLVRREHITP